MGGIFSTERWGRAAATRPERRRPRRVAVVVMGDVGRSPRMQYHAMSLASHKVMVSLIGYKGEKCFHDVERNPLISLRHIDPPLAGPWGRTLRQRSYLLFALLKAIALAYRVLVEILGLPSNLDAILVQNPPALPVLCCVYVASVVRRCQMMVDWHNLGFTMFTGCGPWHPLVWMTKAMEGFFARRADTNFCVSAAMKTYIKSNFRAKDAFVVYDQPPVFFRPPTLKQRHELFTRLLKRNKEFEGAALAFEEAEEAEAADDGEGREVGDNVSSSSNRFCQVPGERATSAQGRAGTSSTSTRPKRNGTGRLNIPPKERELLVEVTPFTRRRGRSDSLRADRPALLVSSTSWTPDEDFSILLDALMRLDRRSSSGAIPSLPYVIVVVTGKGPQKAHYLEKIREMRLTRVSICTAWLEPADYPLLLGSADLGICLHTSTSGLDLPMKVVDMFGCGLPVCAFRYDALKEMVQEGHNGCTFRDGRDLAMQLEALLEGYPRAGGELAGYKANVEEVRRWAESWNQYAWPLFEINNSRFLKVTEAELDLIILFFALMLAYHIHQQANELGLFPLASLTSLWRGA